MTEAEVILRTLASLVEPLAALLPGECEVTLHDLRDLPNSVVAIAGNLTGQTVGGPAPASLQQAAAEGTLSTALSHGGRDRDGHDLRSSTLIFRDSTGEPVAALCVDNETQSWEMVAELARSMLPWTSDGGRSLAPAARGVDEHAQWVLAQAIAAARVPVDLMQKRHKIAVVKDLRERGFFTLREGVETAAQALGVTRFTVYNYLNELDQQS